MLRIFDQHYLIRTLILKEISERYRGSVLGFVWSFMHPIIMLLIYIFVFGFVFKIKWGVSGEGGNAEFGIMLFSGMLIHALLSECLVRSPGIIVANQPYVKKIVFPLDIFPLVIIGTALFHMVIGIVILLIFQLLYTWHIPWTIILIPIVVMPLVIFCWGMSLILSSLGVFIRDLVHIAGIMSTVLLFISPVFYPLSAVPEPFRPLLYLNPITAIIEQFRKVAVLGEMFDWQVLTIYMAIALLLVYISQWLFGRTKKAFADVL